MASLQPVSELEWERHKDVLKGMYCTDGLPLLNRKGNGNEPGVVELMKERYAFVASPSQYELQFKKWGFTKNLKSGEWAALISEYDRLRQTKRDVRITVSGSVLNKNKIDRARRRYGPPHKCRQSAIYKGGSVPASRQAHVEFRDESGEWRRSSGSQVANHSTAMILCKPSHLAGVTSLEDESHPNTPRLDMESSILRDERPLDLVLSSQDLFPDYLPSSPNIVLDDFINQSLSIDNSLFSSLLLSPSNLTGLPDVSTLDSSEGSNALRHVISEKNHQDIVVRGTASVSRNPLEGARSLITSLVQRSRTGLDYETGALAATEMPDVDEIMENLESLLPETETPSYECAGLTLSMGNSFASSGLFGTLLYSFTNNFAGLRDVPRASIMQLIREQHDIRTQLFDVIKNGQPSVAKSLAHNFFRAAVEGNDANATATIIQHTKCNPSLVINPNDVVCNFEDDEYTPIELAANFRNTELVRTLLSSRADPNKTCNPNHGPKWKQGALGLALRWWDNGSLLPFKPSPPTEPEPVSHCLLKSLLDSGAQVRIDLVENAMRPGPGHTAIAEELMIRIPASEHHVCFESEWLLVSVVHYLENSAADRIIRRLFNHCFESDDCGNCISKKPMLVEKLLCHAARRANLELTKFLVHHTAQLQSALAAAIRASSDEMVEFLLNKGARVSDPVEPWRHSEHSENCCPDLYDECGYDRQWYTNGPGHEQYVITPIRTPLAEAIRSSNRHLVDTFERLGARACLSDKHHFRAAVLAAAEIVNTSYLKSILDHASRHNEGWSLTLALAVTIRNGETDSALLLLNAGANLDVGRAYSERRHGDPLIIALERSNKRVVDYMLECDVKVVGGGPNGKRALEAAAAWGDFELINDLARLGGRIEDGIKMTPLGAAVKTRDRHFVSQILDLGVDSKVLPTDSLDGVTPLRTAMELGDYDMVRFLISRGVSPADTCAFLYVMSHDPVGYEILLSEFRTKHPHGLAGFGGQLLAQAIELGSHPLMESLLIAGMDMNSWCRVSITNKGISGSTKRAIGHSRRRVLGVAIEHHKARNQELIRHLLDRHVDIELIVYEFIWESSSGTRYIRETPLLLAIQCRELEVVRMLLEHGAELNRPARRGVKQTPLQAACETGSYTMVEFLLSKGARVNDAAAERYGGTALQLAAQSGSLKIVRLLLDNGANLFMPKSKVGGRTPFEAAAESGCIGVLSQLWNAALPLRFSDEECSSAKEFARQKGHRGCVDFIDFLSGGCSQSFLDE